MSTFNDAVARANQHPINIAAGRLVAKHRLPDQTAVPAPHAVTLGLSSQNQPQSSSHNPADNLQEAGIGGDQAQELHEKLSAGEYDPEALTKELATRVPSKSLQEDDLPGAVKGTASALGATGLHLGLV